MLIAEIACGWRDDRALGHNKLAPCLDREPDIFLAHELERFGGRITRRLAGRGAVGGPGLEAARVEELIDLLDQDVGPDARRFGWPDRRRGQAARCSRLGPTLESIRRRSNFVGETLDV